MVPTLQPPLSNVQVELLKLYAKGVSDETLLELKKVVAAFFLENSAPRPTPCGKKKSIPTSFFGT